MARGPQGFPGTLAGERFVVRHHDPWRSAWS
jgi:hypothetical protein